MRRLLLLLIALTALAVVSPASAEPMRVMQLGEYQLGDANSYNPASDLADTWYRTWDCKEEGCAPGEAVVAAHPECLSGKCIRLSVLSPDTNASRDSVGITDWRAHKDAGLGGIHDGMTAVYQWNFRFGQGFPTAADETQFVNITEAHATGFNAPGHPLVINAQLGTINVTSDGWNQVKQTNTRNFACRLATSYEAGKWYTIRGEVTWDDIDGQMTWMLDDPDTGPGWDKVCRKADDGTGTLFHDPDGSVDQTYIAQNLYRGAAYTRPMTVFYDNFVQDPALAGTPAPGTIVQEPDPEPEPEPEPQPEPDCSDVQQQLQEQLDLVNAQLANSNDRIKRATYQLRRAVKVHKWWRVNKALMLLTEPEPR